MFAAAPRCARSAPGRPDPTGTSANRERERARASVVRGLQVVARAKRHRRGQPLPRARLSRYRCLLVQGAGLREQRIPQARPSSEALLREIGPDTDYCKQPEPKLDEIAWTCLNTGVSYPRQLRPRGLKKPNGWGLHDIIGNAFEWVNDDFNGLSHGIAPLADPFGIPLPTGMSQARGGAVNTWSGMCRAAFHFQGPKNAKGPISGLRLVRTIK